MHPLETYLTELREIRSSGAAVNELSYYPPLANLLNAVGKTLSPKVRAIQHTKNIGAGIPDFGLFTFDQFQKASGLKPLPNQLPSRGAGEVKGLGEDIHETAKSQQVARYLEKYGTVLVTNYREFMLVGRDIHGRLVTLDRYVLAETEAAFWAATLRPKKTMEQHGERFLEYLKRVMMHAAPIADPKDLAWMLASYARDARIRIEQAGDLPALDDLRIALEQSLGIEFRDKKGEHFFKSTLVQTLFYGVFSAWVLWHNNPSPRQPEFDWRLSTYYLHVPVLQALYYQLANPLNLKSLGLVEDLDCAGAVLNRVDRGAFFSRFDQGQAVQYFYEPFLEAYDPELRKELGVWYTPKEIVRYMVERVDWALRAELGVEDGLADPNVYVLDPACGTAAYPLEVLRRIATTLKEKGEDALLAYELKKAATERVFGFELLPAPFVIGHLQIGLFLQQFDSTLEEGERAGIFLTNSLTGWEPPKEPKQHLMFPEFEDERDAAEQIKRKVPILVILGNPPYNGFSGIASTTEERDFIQPYKEGLIERWGIKKFNLDDLYVRFFRLAEHRIVEGTGKGIICYISNFSYLGDPSFVVMRQRFLKEFDSMCFDCLNGDSRETGKLTPEGNPDPSVFSTEYNREGIRVGMAIGLMVRNRKNAQSPLVHFREFWGTNKVAELVSSLDNTNESKPFLVSKPDASNRFSFRPIKTTTEYASWPRVIYLCSEEPISGLQERGGGTAGKAA